MMEESIKSICYGKNVDLIARGKVRTSGGRLKRLQAAVPIVADNVAEYLWKDIKVGDDDPAFKTGQLKWNDYPNVMPPFDNYFVEWVVPFAELRAVGKWHGVHIVRVGHSGSIQNGRRLVTVQCELYATDADFGNSVAIGPAISYELKVAEDGSCVDARVAEQQVKGETDEETDAMRRSYLSLMQPAFLATSFMHCRNVTQTTVTPPPKLAKAQGKRHGVPLVRYRTIDIDPMRQVLKSEGQVHENGIKRALHICRGHFRTYTEEKPLFGKVTGTFFVPMHARGSASDGVVVQDYVVKSRAVA
jgi:hypothetical protein